MTKACEIEQFLEQIRLTNWYHLLWKIIIQELGLGPSIPVHAVLNDWIRHTDGKLSFLGFVKLLRGPSSRALTKAQ